MTTDPRIDPTTGGPHTADVAQVVVDGSEGKPLRPGGRLADITPPLLDLMGLEKPADMTGRSLLEACSRDISRTSDLPTSLGLGQIIYADRAVGESGRHLSTVGREGQPA